MQRAEHFKIHALPGFVAATYDDAMIEERCLRFCRPYSETLLVVRCWVCGFDLAGMAFAFVCVFQLLRAARRLCSRGRILVVASL